MPVLDGQGEQLTVILVVFGSESTGILNVSCEFCVMQTLLWPLGKYLQFQENFQIDHKLKCFST